MEKSAYLNSRPILITISALMGWACFKSKKRRYALVKLEQLIVSSSSIAQFKFQLCVRTEFERTALHSDVAFSAFAYN